MFVPVTVNFAQLGPTFIFDVIHTQIVTNPAKHDIRHGRNSQHKVKKTVKEKIDVK